MIFTETKLKGAFILDLDLRADDRGAFARTFCAQEFAEHGLKSSCGTVQFVIQLPRRNPKGNALSGCTRLRNKAGEMYEGGNL